MVYTIAVAEPDFITVLAVIALLVVFAAGIVWLFVRR